MNYSITADVRPRTRITSTQRQLRLKKVIFLPKKQTLFWFLTKQSILCTSAIVQGQLWKTASGRVPEEQEKFNNKANYSFKTVTEAVKSCFILLSLNRKTVSPDKVQPYKHKDTQGSVV